MIYQQNNYNNKFMLKHSINNNIIKNKKSYEKNTKWI